MRVPSAMRFSLVLLSFLFGISAASICLHSIRHRRSLHWHLRGRQHLPRRVSALRHGVRRPIEVVVLNCCVAFSFAAI